MQVNTNSKSVALLGKAFTSLPLHKASNADEFWGVGTVYQDDVPHLNRLYEIHDPVFLAHPAYDQEHWRNLQAGIPGVDVVIMQDRYPNIPQSERYPLQGAKALCNGGKRGGNVAHYFMSSFDYMLAAAILEGFERIEVYGFDLGRVGTQTEYMYQLPSGTYWLGQAIGRDIDVYIPPESSLLAGKMYGFEGAQTIEGERFAEIRAELLTALDSANEKYAASRDDGDALLAVAIAGALEALDQVQTRCSFEVDGKPVAFRAGLELVRTDLESQRMTSLGVFNRVNAQLHERLHYASRPWTDEHAAGLVEEIQSKHTQAAARVHSVDGALQLLERMISECDSDGPQPIEIQDRTRIIKD